MSVVFAQQLYLVLPSQAHRLGCKDLGAGPGCVSMNLCSTVAGNGRSECSREICRKSGHTQVALPWVTNILKELFSFRTEEKK